MDRSLARPSRHTVDSLVKLCVDFIKSTISLHVPFAGHVSASMTPAEASDVGQKSIEHLEFLQRPGGGCSTRQPELLASYREDANQRLCSTVPTVRRTAPGLIRRLAVFATLLRSSAGDFRRFLRRQNGFARVVSVSLQVRTEHLSRRKRRCARRSLHDELTLLVDAGFTPAQVFALRLQTQRAS